LSKSSKRGSSCFGLFAKAWLTSFLTMSCLIAGTVGLGIRFLGWNAQAWSEVSAWNSYPALALLVVTALSTIVAFAWSAFIGAASALLGSQSRSSKSAKPAARPQSSRKTTV
jgi:ABC-type phosphate transport system permease subunit